jgi:hypothetical protein
MRSISWMTFIFVVAFAMYFRTYESFSSSNRDHISRLQNQNTGIERSLSSVEAHRVEKWKELQEALEPQPSTRDLN